MLNNSTKSGFTLIEVVVVVAIMGILTTIGVSGVRSAVANSRMKDCALNTAAFLERIANDANRMSKPLCLATFGECSGRMLMAYDCDDDVPNETKTCKTITNPGERQECYCTVTPDGALASLSLEAPAKFGCEGVSIDEFEDFNGFSWIASDKGDHDRFEPRIGLSAAPESYVCMQYGKADTYALAIKFKNLNMIVPKWRTGNSWQDVR